MKIVYVLVGTILTISGNVIHLLSVAIFLGGAHNPGACKAVRSSYSACTVMTRRMGKRW